MQELTSQDATTSAFTIAFGMQSYRDMAVNLARSIEKHNSDIPFFILTDRALELPKCLRNTKVIIHNPNDYGKGFSVKLNLDRLAPSDCALFIDADCLVYKDLKPLFKIFDGKSVGVLGISRTDGEMFGDVASVCEACGVSSLPHFNGGVYYLERGEASAAIYTRARELEPDYDSLGLVRLRGQPNDEVLVAIALAQYGVLPTENDGSFYADFQWWPQVEKLDILKGTAVMRNPPPDDPLHQNSFPATNAKPAIVHFLGHHVERPLYRREINALTWDKLIPFPSHFAWLMAAPSFSLLSLKNFVRPMFHMFFQPRSIQKSKTRLIVSVLDE